jgi:hypothetical protein
MPFWNQGGEDVDLHFHQRKLIFPSIPFSNLLLLCSWNPRRKKSPAKLVLGVVKLRGHCLEPRIELWRLAQPCVNVLVSVLKGHRLMECELAYVASSLDNGVRHLWRLLSHTTTLQIDVFPLKKKELREYIIVSPFSPLQLYISFTIITFLRVYLLSLAF